MSMSWFLTTFSGETELNTRENFLYGAVNCQSQIAEHHLQTNHHIDLNSIQQNTTNYLL